jgi:hypothetical protein
MSIVTPGVPPASVLLRQESPAWLEHWCRFAATLRPSELPYEARERAELVLLDSIGVIASGMQEAELRARRINDIVMAADNAPDLALLEASVAQAPAP